MNAPKPKPLIEPRGWTVAQVAARLGVSASWFSEHREDLYINGFPRPDALTNRTDSRAVERWLDMRSGLAANDDLGFDPFLEGVRNHGQRHA
jgi:hypothetical protein